MLFDIDWNGLTLAQEGTAPPPPPPNVERETTTTTTTPGGGPAPPGGGAGSPFSTPFFMLLFVVLGAMIIFSFMGQRRDRKKRQEMLGSVKKHDRVQTVGGVIGSIVELKPDTVVLRVDESSNTRITFARTAIQQVLTAGVEASPPQGRME